MSRSRLLVFAIALAIAGVLVRRFLEEQALEPQPLAQTPQPGGGSQPAASDTAGNPDSSDPPSVPRAELYAEAQRLNVRGRSKMSKEQLAQAVAAARGAEGS
jgi:hypothetical protein